MWPYLTPFPQAEAVGNLFHSIRRPQIFQSFCLNLVRITVISSLKFNKIDAMWAVARENTPADAPIWI